MIRSIEQNGFSLLEIVIVIGIIAILATLAIPSQFGRITQARVVEALDLVEPYQANINRYYQLSGGEFPDDNEAADMPEADNIKGLYLKKLEVRAGALHLTLGQNLPESLHDKVISLRPVFVENTPQTPLSWVCAGHRVPDGMQAAGVDLSNLDTSLLPGRCR